MYGRNSATDKLPLRVLYDGWPLVRSPGSPAAVHLYEILALVSGRVDAWIAYPENPGASHPSPDAQAVLRTVKNHPAARLRWEQSVLPGLALEIRAHRIHTTGLHPPLFTRVPCLVSPAGEGSCSQKAVLERARDAAGQAGLSRARAVVWPDDLPPPAWADSSLQPCPPFAHPAFFQSQPRLDGLPDSYAACIGPPASHTIDRIAQAWGWVQAAGLDAWGLVACGMLGTALHLLRDRLAERQVPVEVIPAPGEDIQTRASVLQHAGAVLLLSGAAPWGDPLLQALACGCPVVGEATRHNDSRVGPAGFLTEPGDARALGAALVSVLVEDEFSQDLSMRARERTRRWQDGNASTRLIEIYQSAAIV